MIYVLTAAVCVAFFMIIALAIAVASTNARLDALRSTLEEMIASIVANQLAVAQLQILDRQRAGALFLTAKREEARAALAKRLREEEPIDVAVDMPMAELAGVLRPWSIIDGPQDYLDEDLMTIARSLGITHCSAHGMESTTVALFRRCRGVPTELPQWATRVGSGVERVVEMADGRRMVRYRDRASKVTIFEREIADA